MQDITSVQPPQLKAIIDKYSPFLVEVRKRIIVTVIVFLFSTIAGFLFYEPVIRFLLRVLSLDGINIVFTSPFQFINLAISCGVASGLILTFPLIVIQVLSFLRPALKSKEYNMIVRYMPLTLVLFGIGFGFGIFIMKWQIEIFLSKSVSLGIGNMLDISRLLSTVLVTAALLGLSFQFPIILLFLLRLGILKRKQLVKVRLWVYLASFIFAIFLPPDSILADFVLALPLIILYELTLLLYRK